MGKIVISENVSLDGVVQDPTGEEGFTRGGWFDRMAGKDRLEWTKVEFDEALGTEALLLGRWSYEWFAARWPSRSGAWAERLNALPKYVVSSTLVDPVWNNSTVLMRRGGRRGLEAEAGAGRGHRRLCQPQARAHVARARSGRRAAADRPPGRPGGRMSASSARRVTNCRCASSTPAPSVTASRRSPTGSSGTPGDTRHEPGSPRGAPRLLHGHDGRGVTEDGVAKGHPLCIIILRDAYSSYV